MRRSAAKQAAIPPARGQAAASGTVWGITIIKKRKVNVYNCKYNCCYDCKHNCCYTTGTCDAIATSISGITRRANRYPTPVASNYKLVVTIPNNQNIFLVPKWR